MSSIVRELQKDALDKSIRVTDLLRKANVVTRKLKLQELQEWIKNETEGYTNKLDLIPSYRVVTGTAKFFNPYHGWIPFSYENGVNVDIYTKRKCQQPISELEHMLLNGDANGQLTMDFSPEMTSFMTQNMEFKFRCALFIPCAFLGRIVDAVRNTILNWALQLEDDGILGEGLAFSADEVSNAKKGQYTVNNFYGDVVNSQVQLGTLNSSQEKR